MEKKNIKKYKIRLNKCIACSKFQDEQRRYRSLIHFQLKN